jgi:mxaA protein
VIATVISLLSQTGAAAVFLVVAVTVAFAAEGKDAAIQPIVNLRDSGYLLGDLVDEHVELALPAGFRLDVDSLPLPGRVAPWLELRSARIDDGQQERDRVNITVTYQVFAEVEQASRVPIPRFTLRLRGATQVQTVTVPEKSFLLSPALPSTLTDEDRVLKPSPPPSALPAARLVAGFVLGLAASLACAAYLLWAYDRLPFLPRLPGPFARAWRRWRRRAHAIRRTTSSSRRELSDAERDGLLRDWHSALNQAAGETLYASTLPRLFARAPYLQPLRQRIENQFDRSWTAFYGRADMTAPRAHEVLELLRSSAERERGVPC